MKPNRSFLEPLEARIAPAGLLPTSANAYVKATLGGPNLIHAGQVLTTGSQDSGSYLLFVEKGDAFVFFTDLNNNRQVDFNELTGIAAGDGLQLTSFVDIHGDIVTNLKKVTAVFPGGQSRTAFSLSDADNTSGNDDPAVGGDGRVLLNNTIEKIELRSLTPADVGDLNRDGTADAADVAIHQPITTTSIFGSIYAGRGFGTADGSKGLIIDASAAINFGFSVHPTIGSIVTGTAANGQYFSFGASNLDDISGYFTPFTPARGQVGGDINGVHVAGGTAATLNLDSIQSGSGGIGARGGNISNIRLPYDDSGGYKIIAGNGGNGPNGGDGGSIVNFSDLGSITGHVEIRSGDGGVGTTGKGGNGGNFTFGTFNVRGDIDLTLGSGGTGFTAGGNGASLSSGIFTQPDDTIGFRPGNMQGTTHVVSGQPVAISETIHGTATSAETQSFVVPPTNFYTLTFNGATTIPISNTAGASAIENALNSLTPIQNAGFVSVASGANGFTVTFLQNGDQPSLTGARAPTVGSQQAVDFNSDGIGDIVYTTLDTSQVVVVLGGPGGFLSTGTAIPLAGVRTPEALVVADLNGDGHPDIAVGSQDDGSHAGVVVFLSKYDTNNKFLGFRDPRFSVLPQLESGDPNVYGTGSLGQFQFLGYVKSPSQISSIQAGDFDGDGLIELAVVETQYNREQTDANAVVQALSFPDQVAVFMSPDVEKDNVTGQNVITGQFYADFGSKGFSANGNTTPPVPKHPFQLLTPLGGGAGSVVVEASPVKNGGAYDVLFSGVVGGKSISTYDYSVRTNPPGTTGIPPFVTIAGTYSLGKVDIDRQLNPNHQSDQDMTFVDFSVTRLDANDTTDLVAISSNLFMVGVRGNGTGGGNPISSAVDNSGTFFGNGGYGVVKSGALLSVKTADANNDGTANDIFILDNFDNSGTKVEVVQGFTGLPQTVPNTQEGTLEAFPDISVKVPNGTPSSDVAFSIHYEDASDVYHPGLIDSGAADLQGVDQIYFGSGSFGFGNVFLDFINTAHTGFSLKTGNGGDSLIGNGGRGGNIGGGLLTKTATAVSGKLNFTYAGDLSFTAGDGGNGFAAGGAGGLVSGVKVRYRNGIDVGLAVSAFGGNGGSGVAAGGGAGGSVFSNTFETSLPQIGAASTPTNNAYVVIMGGGNGGDGRVGGNGGTVTGNGGPSSFSYDSLSLDILITAGHGGNGSSTAGSGGSINNYHHTFPPPANVTGSLSGDGIISYIAGNGGSSVSGRGGSGGSITQSTPATNAFVDDTVTLIAGDAGDGITGGAGGTVSGFNLQLASISLSPTQVTVHAGNGGLGSSGDGGAGGGIANIVIPSRGTGGLNSVLAGNGGDTAGRNGGQGGNVSNVRVQSTQGAVAVVAGAGGSGLLLGGNGGTDFNVTVETGSSTQSKVLVIAGAGGDAFAFIPNPIDSASNQAEKAFGGRVGKGGNGGDVTGLFQLAGNTGAHFDIIAGNGGSTKNYGTVFDPKNFVGRGGSVTNVNITGDFGNIAKDDPNTPDNQFTIDFLDANENVPIKSYNDSQAGETIAQFITTNLRNGSTPLTDQLGNVGIVVGAAGRNKAIVDDPIDKPDTFVTQPAGAFPQNGVLVNIRGHNLLSAVAGSVDAIASIQKAQNIIIDLEIGSDKGVFERGSNGAITNTNLALDLGRVGQPDFLDENGELQNAPSLNGRLIDGAVVAHAIVDAAGNPITLKGTSGYGGFLIG